MSTKREELKDEITSIIYGADWKESDLVDAFKPDVEAAMKLVDAYAQEVAQQVIGEDEQLWWSDTRIAITDVVAYTLHEYTDQVVQNQLRAQQRQTLKALLGDD